MSFSFLNLLQPKPHVRTSSDFALPFATLVAMLLAVPAVADDFSVRAWSQSVQSAIANGDQKTLTQLLDLKRIEGTALSRKASPDRIALETARKLYEKNKLNEAIDWYEKVPKGSDFWLEAVEEKGWAYLKAEQFDKSLSQTKTLMAPAFNQVIGAEPFFLRSLAQLRICDYKGIIETHRLFKDSNRARVASIQLLADTGSSEAVLNIIAKTDRFPMSLDAVQEHARNLPRLFYRDANFQKSLMRIKMADAALPLLRVAHSEGVNRRLIGASIARLEANRKIALATLPSRLKVLAQKETNENFKMLQKLNLVEVELIQRVHIDQGANADEYSRNEFSDTNPDQLVFVDDGKPWLDELDKYQYEVGTCKKNIRRRM